jgi:RNA-directed DNA polymerase
MRWKVTFEDELRIECQKLISRHEDYARELRDEDHRRRRRSGLDHRGSLRRPTYWSIDRAFNPYKVRASAGAVSRAIKLALRNHDYRPFNPIAYEVPKSDNTKRIVSVFGLGDATVSRRVYRSLLTKNKARFSAYSYAYRDDLTAHDAILNIGADLRDGRRYFLAEYDFSKYFDSISHEYLWKILDEKAFLISPLERVVLAGFLASRLQIQGSYSR